MDANHQSTQKLSQLDHVESFERFFRKNNQLFDIIGLKNAKSILKAVWDARNEELELMETNYQKRMENLEKQVLEYRIDFEKRVSQEQSRYKKQREEDRESDEDRISLMRTRHSQDLAEVKAQSDQKVEEYRIKFEELERKHLKLIEEFRVEKDIWSTGMLERDHDIKNLTEHLEKSKDALMKLKEKYIKAEDSSKENQTVVEEMIQQNISLNKKIESLTKSYQSIENALAVELKNRKKLEDYIEKLELNIEGRENTVETLTKKYETQIHWLKSENARLEKALEDLQQYSKKYKEMNSRLSHELMKSESASQAQASYF